MKVNKLTGEEAGATSGVTLRLGNCNNGLNDGLRARNWNNTATNANWNIVAAFILSNIGR